MVHDDQTYFITVRLSLILASFGFVLWSNLSGNRLFHFHEARPSFGVRLLRACSARSIARGVYNMLFTPVTLGASPEGRTYHI